MEGSKKSGMIEALSLWGRVCGNQANCEICPIFAIRGAGLTCQEFASKHPEKFLSLLEELDSEEYTYYNEFCNRFPEANLTVEELAVCACRKALFEGYGDCGGADDGLDCEECWKQRYTGDVTMFDENEDDEDDDDLNLSFGQDD